MANDDDHHHPRSQEKPPFSKTSPKTGKHDDDDYTPSPHPVHTHGDTPRKVTQEAARNRKEK
jgi:hypothetical protein